MQLKLGPLNYAIDFVEAVEHDGETTSHLGQNDVTRLRIQVRNDRPKTFQRVVLAHEVIHAIYNNAGRQEQIEDDVDMIAFGLVEFLQRNPDVVQFLTESGE